MTKKTAQQMIARQLSVPDVEVLELMTPGKNIWFARCIDNAGLEDEAKAAADPTDPDVAKQVYEESPKQFVVQIQFGQCSTVLDDEIDELKRAYPLAKFIKD